MTQNNDTFVPPVQGAQLPPPPSEVLEGITFNDQPSVPTEQKTAESPKTPEAATPVESKQEVSTPPEVKTDKKDANLPSRFEGESDVRYNLRTKLFVLGQAKANSESLEDKSLIAKEIKQVRDDLAKTSKEEQQKTTPSNTNVSEVPATDREAVLNSLRELGFKPGDEVTKEAEVIARKLIEERFNAEQESARAQEQADAVSEFYAQRSDIYSNDSMRKSLEEYVLQMFKPQLPSMSKEQLSQVLDMAATYLFPKETVDRKIESAQDKLDKLNIHGTQGGDVKPSSVSDKSKNDLRSLGWSDEDIKSFEK